MEQVGGRNGFKSIDINLEDTWVVGNERGLDSLVQTSIKSSQMPTPDFSGRIPLIVTVETRTRLTECLPPVCHSRDGIETVDRIWGREVERAERERIVRVAREEIQAAIEWTHVLARGRDLEMATTGILDVGVGGECDLCEKKHRNRECWFHSADWTNEAPCEDTTPEDDLIDRK